MVNASVEADDRPAAEMRSSTWSGFGQGADPVSSLRCGLECPQAASAAIPISSNPGRRTWPSIHPRLHQVDAGDPPARPSTSEHTSPLTMRLP
jgi:hypothetical protein